MTGAVGLSRQEQELITSRWIPDIPEGPMTPRAVQRLTDAIWEGSAPLASFVLNRLAAWLEGDAPFNGNDVFEVSWERQQQSQTSRVFSRKGRNNVNDTRTCTLYRHDDGATWAVTWGRGEYRDVPEISLSRIDAGGEKLHIASGEITTGEPRSGNRHGLSDCPPPVKGTVEADIASGGFKDLWAFCSAIRASMPEDLLAVDLKDAVTYAHLSRLEDIAPIMEADGGLPGRLCGIRQDMIVHIVNGVHGHWMRDKFAPLVSGLRERGAEWGKAVMSYNDRDYHCCVIDFSDGSVGIFNDNSATCADESAYVARLEMVGDAVKSVGVYLFDAGARDYASKIEAIGNRAARPDYVHDFETTVTTTPGGRAGWAAMVMYLWQSMADSTYALNDGRLDESPSYWGGTAALIAHIP